MILKKKQNEQDEIEYNINIMFSCELSLVEEGCVKMISQDHIMLHERLRLLSFDKRWLKSSPHLSAENMAKEGFIFSSPPDIVRCVFCSIYLGKWEESDIPAIEHARYSPNCRRKDNITIEEENYDNNILRLYEERYSTFNCVEDSSVQEEYFEKLPPHHLHCDFCKSLRDKAEYFARNGYFLHKNPLYLQCVYCKYIIGEPTEKVIHLPFCLYDECEKEERGLDVPDIAYSKDKSHACSIL
jgi:hypothetical protein